jgi:hypothetical protein
LGAVRAAVYLAYSGRRGGGPLGEVRKYFVYAYYPLHLLVLWAIRWPRPDGPKQKEAVFCSQTSGSF